jgi:ADP-ribose pyrophosphatase YjhB (NUDIX family)
MTAQFNIRVYGLLINEHQQILVSDELIRGAKITKFPGGGLEIGEGTIDCLQREFLEELNLKVEVLEHFYTTDFYQQSAFNTNQQIISIYYKVKALEPIQIDLKIMPFDFDAKAMKQYTLTQETEVFRLVSLNNLKEEDVTLPIDKVVVKMLSNQA